MSAYAPAVDDLSGFARRRSFLVRRSDTPRGYSHETKVITQMWNEAWMDFAFPVTHQVLEIANVFQAMAKRWREETILGSSISEATSNHWYREIIALGRPVVPLILHDLKNHPDYWFAALREITGEDPVPPEHKGNFELMRQDWLRWAEREGTSG